MHPPSSRTMFELLVEQAQRLPDAVAVLDAECAVTFRELSRRAGTVAASLRRRGVRRGDRVGLLACNCVEWLEIFFASAALGTTLVPLSTWSKAGELEFLLEDSGVATVFAMPSFAGREFLRDIDEMRSDKRLAGLQRLVAIGGEAHGDWLAYDDFRHGEPVGAMAPGIGASAGDTLVILYTSGSSSRPKAVPLEHFAAIENGYNIGARQGLRIGDRVLVSIPLFWSYGAVNALPAILTHGATMVLQQRFEPGGALELIERHRCTGLYTLPAMTNALLAHPGFSRQRTLSLRSGVTIGAPRDVVRAAQDLGASEICNIYGSTETYGNCAVTWSHWPLELRAGCQGPPLPGVEIRIRSETGEALLGVDEVGRIEVRGYLMRGYRGHSASHNAEVMTEDGWFRTGDLGFLDAGGNLHYTGRNSEMIKRSGINVAPVEVEEALQQHPAVALAGVTARADADLGERIVAFVVLRHGLEGDPVVLRDHCRQRLSSYKLPDEIRFVPALPLTDTGKLMRRELREQAEFGDRSTGQTSG